VPPASGFRLDDRRTGVDDSWLDRSLVDRRIDGPLFSKLTYDPELGHDCFRGEPFTGFCKYRYRDGTLEAVSQFEGGVEHGVSVAWYPNGQVKLYTEIEYEARSGDHLEWNEDGSVKVRERYKGDGG
jgi:hypothetical protein